MTTMTLPAPTDDLDRAEHDLHTHAICAVSGVLETAGLGLVNGVSPA